MASMMTDTDATLVAFAQGLPTSDAGKAEAYIADFLSKKPLREVLMATAAIEAGQELGRAQMARTCARRCCGSVAGSRVLTSDEATLSTLLEGVKHSSINVRVAALACLEATVGALKGELALFAQGAAVKAALAAGLLDEELSVADAARKVLVAMGRGGAVKEALNAVASARSGARNSTYTLRCCEAEVHIGSISDAAFAEARPMLEETTSLARGDNGDDPLSQLNALELVTEIGSTAAGARMLLVEDRRTLEAIVRLARGGGDPLFADALADAAMGALARVLGSGAKALMGSEKTVLQGDPNLDAFFELVLGKFSAHLDQHQYGATIDALAAFAGASPEATDRVLASEALANAWLAEVPRASPGSRAARLRSVASTMESTNSRTLWAAYAQRSAATSLLKACTSPHEDERCAALELAKFGVSLAPASFVGQDGFYEWIARPASQSESSALTIQLKHAVLKALVGAAAAHEPALFNDETLSHLKELAAKGGFFSPKGLYEPQVHAARN